MNDTNHDHWIHNGFFSKRYYLIETSAGDLYVLLPNGTRIKQYRAGKEERVLSTEERLIQYSKIALGIIGLAILAWKL